MSLQAISPEDLKDLKYAKNLLENPSFAARLANSVGAPIEMGFKLLPNAAKKMIAGVTNRSLQAALRIAVSTMSDGKQTASNWSHKFAVMTSGAVGGAFGIPALVIELPISTTIMLRSIADVARSEGEVISSVDGKLACLEVFALGGRSNRDDESEKGYFAVRAVLAKSVTEAAEYLVGRAVVEETAPPLVRLIAQVTTRFGIQVSEKAMAQLVPVIGAVGGAGINTLFIDHFQKMARGHFIVRRLERTYGKESIKLAYDAIPTQPIHLEQTKKKEILHLTQSKGDE